MRQELVTHLVSARHLPLVRWFVIGGNENHVEDVAYPKVMANNKLRVVFIYPDSKSHGANMGPMWDRQDPGGPRVGTWTLLSE